jgi:hypothetical protein
MKERQAKVKGRNEIRTRTRRADDGKEWNGMEGQTHVQKERNKREN